jgi:hypothetical protein
MATRNGIPLMKNTARTTLCNKIECYRVQAVSIKDLVNGNVGVRYRYDSPGRGRMDYQPDLSLALEVKSIGSARISKIHNQFHRRAQ